MYFLSYFQRISSQSAHLKMIQIGLGQNWFGESNSREVSMYVLHAALDFETWFF